MRKITPDEFAVYTLDELEPDAREKAIDTIREKLGGDWWDSADIDDISDVMVYTLAHEFGTPGYGEYGVGDFPGIPGAELVGWDLEQGSAVLLRGTLTRENAPSLPWADGIEEARLISQRAYTTIDVETDEDALDPDQERDLTVVRTELAGLVTTMEDAVERAMQAALKDGRAEMEYKTSEEEAIAQIESGEREFYADGTLYA